MNVLLLGDSHTVGSYGNALTALFASKGANVVRLANVGATGGNYLTGKYQQDYAAVARQSFDVAIITLGTNDAAASDSTPTSRSADTIKKLADGLNARQVWYVGPPSFSANAATTYNKVFAGPGKDLNTRADAMFKSAQAVFGDRAIDSRPSTAPFVKQNDIHLGKDGGEAWAAAVFAKVNAAPSSGISVLSVVALIGAALVVRKWIHR